eukprot:s2915_g18.t1
MERSRGDVPMSFAGLAKYNSGMMIVYNGHGTNSRSRSNPDEPNARWQQFVPVTIGMDSGSCLRDNEAVMQQRCWSPEADFPGLTTGMEREAFLLTVDDYFCSNSGNFNRVAWMNSFKGEMVFMSSRATLAISTRAVATLRVVTVISAVLVVSTFATSFSANLAISTCMTSFRAVLAISTLVTTFIAVLAISNP